MSVDAIPVQRSFSHSSKKPLRICHAAGTFSQVISMLKEALIKSGAQDAGISYADVVRFFVRNSFAVPIA